MKTIACLLFCVLLAFFLHDFVPTEIVEAKETYFVVSETETPPPDRVYENNNNSLSSDLIEQAVNSVEHLHIVSRFVFGSGIYLDIETSCSGTVIFEIAGYHYVISSAHCFPPFFSNHPLYSRTIVVGGIEGGEMVATDKTSDSALIRIPRSDSFHVLPALLGDSDALRPGDFLYAIGYPFGIDLEVSTGVVRNIRAPEFDENGVVIGYDYTRFVFENPINQGHSGGLILAVFQGRLEIVGTISAYYQNGNNINIAVGINATLSGLQLNYADLFSPAQLICGE